MPITLVTGVFLPAWVMASRNALVPYLSATVMMMSADDACSAACAQFGLVCATSTSVVSAPFALAMPLVRPAIAAPAPWATTAMVFFPCLPNCCTRPWNRLRVLPRRYEFVSPPSTVPVPSGVGLKYAIPAAPRTGTISSALTAPPVAKVTLASTNWRPQSAVLVRSFSLLHTTTDNSWVLPSAVLAPPLALKYLAAACADGAISHTEGGWAALHT